MTVLVVVNKGKEHVGEAWDKLRSHLKARSIDYRLYSDEDRETHAIDPAEMSYAIALGGDGTILKAAHLIAGNEVPLLGVQFGRLGFLAGCSPADMIPAVDAMLEGTIDLEHRAVLSAEASGEIVTYSNLYALNEVAVARGASGRIITYEINIAGSPIAKMRGDGILVATATGSTGYALSAGGPVVAPGFQGLVVVPIAPHTLNARAIMTDPEDEVVIRLVESKRDEGELFIDGEVFDLLEQPKEIRIRRGEHDILLARYGEHADFYAAISSVFFGGVDA